MTATDLPTGKNAVWPFSAETKAAWNAVCDALAGLEQVPSVIELQILNALEAELQVLAQQMTLLAAKPAGIDRAAKEAVRSSCGRAVPWARKIPFDALTQALSALLVSLDKEIWQDSTNRFKAIGMQRI